jgi:hypothetical protein
MPNINKDNTKNLTDYIVKSSSEDEVLLHGIRIKGKSIVVELADLNKDLQPDQLHVGMLDEVNNMRLLSDMNDSERKEYGVKIWKSLAQALQHFTFENMCTIGTVPTELHINQEFTKVYLTKWIKSDASQLEAVGSIEQQYIKQLTYLYIYLSTGKDLNNSMQNLENKNWDKIHLKQELELMSIDSDLKEVFSKGLQLDGNMYISINALMTGISSYFYIPQPKGLAAFAASTWIAFSTQITITSATLATVYSHTLK